MTVVSLEQARWNRLEREYRESIEQSKRESAARVAIEAAHPCNFGRKPDLRLVQDD